MELDYRETIEQSIYATVKGIAEDYKLNYRSLLAWINGEREPREDNKKRLEEVMYELKQKPAMQKHPSYGWAYPEQIKRLNEIGIGPERDKIMADIAKQTKLKGKLK